MRAYPIAIFAAVAAFAVVPHSAALAKQASATTRPAEDKVRDADRKPAEMLKFAKITKGKTVVEMLPGAGYYTRVFSDAVGAKGKVYTYWPQTFAKAAEGSRKINAEPGRGNIEAVVGPLSQIAPAGIADVVWTSQNYHDLKGPRAPKDATAQVNKAAWDALKPGGLYVISDHSAEAGSGMRDVDTLHRIDAAALKAEVLAAGFVFDGESTALANAADDRKLNVFKPEIRGHTDQFTFRFRKPKS